MKKIKFFAVMLIAFLGILSGSAVSSATAALPAVAPAGVPVAVTQASDGGAGTESAQSCLDGGFGNTILVRSCNYNITVRMLSGCLYGHFKVWNKYNTAQYRNSSDSSKCYSLGTVSMGAAWSNETCGTFYRLDNGIYTQVGDIPCNHDS
ncbi:hypothetical protein L6E12_10520 [Actinokineospora sp. PR83]|uniref:hypothetical protein n=1 Tax=Actinokineospora sp. PR83 TaxID=2884908 RepID=UPI001F241704|nr:hypothetical protein [Actinokineospora sp. PR83]MCG8916222.1 hypothetical protein [Actinokineospora sp. PR83]